MNKKELKRSKSKEKQPGILLKKQKTPLSVKVGSPIVGQRVDYPKTPISSRTKSKINVADLLRENRNVKLKIRSVEEKFQRKEEKAKKKRQEQQYQETFKYKILQTFSFLQPANNDAQNQDDCGINTLGATPQEKEQIQRDIQNARFKKLLSQNEEFKRIRRGRDLWKVVRRKRRVIQMMAKMGETVIFELDNRRLKEQNKKDQEDEQSQKISRFIIMPDNYWNMQWNNLILVIFIIWIFLTPIYVSQDYQLSEQNFSKLFIFDLVFMADRFLDLFVSFYNPNGLIEHRLHSVILNNISFKMFLEVFISIAPFTFREDNKITGYYYAVFKIARYSRLFEMDAQITNIIEHQASSKTVFELKQMEKAFDLFKFILSTCCNLHIMSCTQIMLCKSRGDYINSWMGSRDVPEDQYDKQYIIAIYFVTTTLSTCGFGDISATRGDSLESLAILLLQFFGMIFYSMSIQKVQSFFVADRQGAGEYAVNMERLTENLVVKVGRQMPIEKKIQGEIIKQWRIFTLKSFQQSPNHFLISNSFYQKLSENMKVSIVKENLMQKFQKEFDTLYNDPEFQFKGDNKLISMICASLQLEHYEPDASVNLLQLGVVSTRMIFMLDGAVEVFYKYYQEPFLIHEQSIYFGEISYLFKTRNVYRFQVQRACDQQVKKEKIYSITHTFLQDIFSHYPDFKNILTIRAMRRQHYYRKLRKQTEEFFLLRHNQIAFQSREIFVEELLKIKKARLIEHQMSYEDLMMNEIFSEDEKTLEYNLNRVQEIKNIKAVKKVRMLKNHINELKRFSGEGLKSIIRTIGDLDKSNRQFMFKRFDKQQQNSLYRDAPILQYQIQNLELKCQQLDMLIDTDAMNSDTSGNHSEQDEINKIQRLKAEALAQKEVSECNQQEVSIIDTKKQKMGKYEHMHKRSVLESQDETEQLRIVPQVEQPRKQNTIQTVVLKSSLSSVPSQTIENTESVMLEMTPRLNMIEENQKLIQSQEIFRN